MTRIVVGLTDEDLRHADRLAAAQHVSRAEIVRRGIRSLATGGNAAGITPEEIERRKAASRRIDEWAKILSKDRTWKPLEILHRERARRERHLRSFLR